MDTTTQWVLVILFLIVFAIVSRYMKRRKDMQIMARILSDREGRDARWAEDLEWHDRLGYGSGVSTQDIIEGHKETLASEERFIEYFRERHGAKNRKR
jgi:hypothetical protein